MWKMKSINRNNVPKYFSIIELEQEGICKKNLPTSPEAPPEERLAALEISFNEWTDIICKIQQQAKEQRLNQSRALESERREREDRDKTIKGLIEKAATDHFWIEVIAVILLVIGVILSHAAPEIEHVILLLFR
ncbi:MAG: hypothetical protein A2Z47_08570 [Thermodesulfovibrio sp. RBG_19FT_COMBO_42_12]|nr:MAG: hypothetical protein A2Z47_08570 [Thermodesulfovibrio sp. RBG_19FT_COMBO_42_12]